MRQKKEICMFILAKSFTNKRGEMFLKIFPNQYPSIETAHAAMQSDYQEELKKRHLDRSDEEAMGLSVETGYYDPDDESSVDVPKQLIGFHYVVLKKNTL